MTYGGIPLSPMPLMNLSKQYQKRGDGIIVGTLFTAQLDGTIFSPSGLSSVIAVQDALRTTFATQGQLFEIKCDGNTLLSVYPRVQGPTFEKSSNNWVLTSPYTITLEFDDDPHDSGENSSLMPPYIADTQESWNMEFVEDKAHYEWVLPGAIADANPYQVRLTHSMSAVGKSHYGSGGLVMPAWQQAKNYVATRLGYDSNFVSNTGVFNLTAANFTPFNHVRSSISDVNAGTFSVSESWVVINPSGTGVAGRALEDFNIEVHTSTETALVVANIQGQIQGLETRSYGSSPGAFAITETKFTAASGYWNTIKDSSRIYPRALLLVSDLNATPVNKVVGYNPVNGVITYSYEYNNRPANCIAGALNEHIVVTDNNPTDVFAEIPIPGRSAGPILQDMGTITSAKRELSIDAVLPFSSGCSVASLFATNPRTSVSGLVALFESDLTSSHTQVFKHINTETWEPKTGRYTRQVGWTYQNGC
jgi:hypothetical protein